MAALNFSSKRIMLVLIALVSMGSYSLVRGQGEEQEPNNSCPAPQDIGAIPLPFVLHGSLDATPEVGDIDFYKFTSPPGTLIVADLEGLPTGQGTLENPLLGVYDARCNQMAVNDDNGFNLNARLQFTVPVDGLFLVAATSCCDYTFSGNPGISGSYRLTMVSPSLIGSVTGIVVDTLTNSPLPGFFPTYTYVELRSCSDFGGCTGVSSQNTDQGGRFRFEIDHFGQRLPAGTYQVFAAAGGYQAGETEPFAVSEAEHKDIGALGLVSLPRIGSISGRVVDSITAETLPGDRPPFTFVELIRCFGSDCFTPVQSQLADAEGRIHFERDLNGLPLEPGSYLIVASAAEYQRGQLGPFDVGEGEHRDVGNLGLQPFPVRFSEIRPCGDLPPEGGRCRYSVRITNRLRDRFEGLAWSPVESFGIGSFTDFTRFDAHRARDVDLGPEQSKVVKFTFDVPHTVRDGVFVCAQVFSGQGDERDAAYFNTVGHKGLFCILKGYTGFTVLSEQEANQIFREAENGMREPAQRMLQSRNQQ